MRPAGSYFFFADFFFAPFFFDGLAVEDFSVVADGAAFFFFPPKILSHPPENLMFDPV